MKPWKLALTSFVIGVALSGASIAAYACSAIIYVQDESDCHMYHRYVLVGSVSGGGVEICSYEDSGGSLHREDTCDAGPILDVGGVY
jgi:hypothetical protein